MNNDKAVNFLKKVLANMPNDWLKLTTHRLDIYNEQLAKVEFLEYFETLFHNNEADANALYNLPTAYDYIRLGHPLSCILEWAIATMNDVTAEQVISFSSATMPILAVLRKNLFDHKRTLVLHQEGLPSGFDADILTEVYGYQLEVQQIDDLKSVPSFDGTVVFVCQQNQIVANELPSNIDFTVNVYPNMGSVLIANRNATYVSAIQHVRRRESIAMTPANCLLALQSMVEHTVLTIEKETEENQHTVIDTIKNITDTPTTALIGSSGLSVQYAIMMGLVHDAIENYPSKAIKFVVPPNCYGGTNDQARRVAACLPNVEIVDLPVDGDNDMVQSIELVLAQLAEEDAIPYIIAEIPTNPRVEVPDLQALKAALTKERKTKSGSVAIDPVFILDQTFCPNFQFLGEGAILSAVRTISYASGSKFPSGGLCTAGYCVGNKRSATLMDKISLHLHLCDNAATDLQVQILAKQMPSMLERIDKAYDNTRSFVNFIQQHLPEAKINFVSETLAQQGFTPSVFSLDLPTKGSTAAEKEAYKRQLNHQLIDRMITNIPNESKYCVSYGQLKGCYWTIPATSTQGTTKESDKDYIARVSVSPDLDLDKHKEVFLDFVQTVINDK